MTEEGGRREKSVCVVLMSNVPHIFEHLVPCEWCSVGEVM